MLELAFAIVFSASACVWCVPINYKFECAVNKNMEAFARLKNQRTAARGYVTCRGEVILDVCDKPGITKIKFMNAFNKFNDRVSKLKAVQELVETESEATEIESCVEEADVFFLSQFYQAT